MIYHSSILLVIISELFVVALHTKVVLSLSFPITLLVSVCPPLSNRKTFFFSYYRKVLIKNSSQSFRLRIVLIHPTFIYHVL